MADLILQKMPFGLVPTDDAGDAFFAKLGTRDLIRCQVTKPRNLAFHRKFFALVNLVVQNTDYDTVDQFLHVLKVRMGHCDFVPNGKGTLAAVPRSISFAKMDNDEFAKFYNHAIDIILKYFMTGADRHDLEMEVIGFAA